ncbi:MAG: HAMP domain-containing histidine kinase [Deltaproteobacteria bacterium]|nr:HAMP domain-containing histidine kinase [Deltaproteobacteria bacterium]
MLSELVAANRTELIQKCRARVSARMAPRPTAMELEHGIPLFLDQLATALRSKLASERQVTVSATKHGGDLLRLGFTIGQVVHDYGDVCQSITELAIEQTEPISTQEFQALNLCLDDAIAGAVTEFARQREVDLVAQGKRHATEDLGHLAHELRNLIATSTLAFDALKGGNVGITGITGSTGQVLGRSLMRIHDLVDRSLAAVRLKAGIKSTERVTICELIEDVEVSAMMEAKAHGHHLIVETMEPKAVVDGDRQILASIIANLVQNAYKYTRPHSQVTLRTTATPDRVRIEVEDQCGGLPPDKIATMFQPFEQASADRSGLGLGLAICVRGAEAMGGKLSVRNIPKEGCVFALELPRVKL